MTAYILKLIAIITMVFDHSGYIFYHHQLSWMNFIGRIAFPIFAFQISEGYFHTRNIKKYYLRLFLFALISELPYLWFYKTIFGKFGINIIFTLIFGLISISIYNFILNLCKSNKKDIIFSYKLCGILAAIIVSVLAEFMKFDYGYYGVLLIFTFYLLRDNKILRNIIVGLLMLANYMPYLLLSHFSTRYILLYLCTLSSLIFINMYNGKKGKDSKLVFYIFYPVHLIVLCFLSFII